MALAAATCKEAAYLERFGRLLLPFQRKQREVYGYEEQLPLDHIKNLELYHRMTPSLVPGKASLHVFCMRHPDFQPSNVIVSTSPGSGCWRIIGLLDWQHTMVLPHFLLASIPGRLQNYGNLGSQTLKTHDLKALLVKATEKWAELAGADVPCPVKFEPDDVSKTKVFSERLWLSDRNFAGCQTIVGFETETWVPNEHYKRGKALAELLKLTVLKEVPAGEARDKAEANWFLDNMNEDNYM